MVITIKLRGLYDVTISDADVVNPGDFIPRGEYNPHHVRPWLALDHGFPIGIVFASGAQDALDELADSGRLDRYKVPEGDLPRREEEDEEHGISYLGNAGEPYQIESMMLEELPTPAFSFCAMMAAMQEGARA